MLSITTIRIIYDRLSALVPNPKWPHGEHMMTLSDSFNMHESGWSDPFQENLHHHSKAFYIEAFLKKMVELGVSIKKYGDKSHKDMAAADAEDKALVALSNDLFAVMRQALVARAYLRSYEASIITQAYEDFKNQVAALTEELEKERQKLQKQIFLASVDQNVNDEVCKEKLHFEKLKLELQLVIPQAAEIEQNYQKLLGTAQAIRSLLETLEEENTSIQAPRVMKEFRGIMNGAAPFIEAMQVPVTISSSEKAVSSEAVKPIIIPKFTSDFTWSLDELIEISTQVFKFHQRADNIVNWTAAYRDWFKGDINEARVRKFFETMLWLREQLFDEKYPGVRKKEPGPICFKGLDCEKRIDWIMTSIPEVQKLLREYEKQGLAIALELHQLFLQQKK